MKSYPHDRVRDAVEQAAREMRLDAQYLGSVYAYLEEDEDAWPRCCGSSCDPCVLTLGAAARRALAILESDPEQPSGGGPRDGR